MFALLNYVVTRNNISFSYISVRESLLLFFTDAINQHPLKLLFSHKLIIRDLTFYILVNNSAGSSLRSSSVKQVHFKLLSLRLIIAII